MSGEFTCPACGHAQQAPPEPPVNTVVRDRYGCTYRRVGEGWAAPGCMPYGRWDAMWFYRGPLEVVEPTP